MNLEKVNFKCFQVLILILFCSLNLYSQNISGQVIDIEGNEIIGATIMLLNSKGRIINYDISNNKGLWSIKFKKEGSILKFNYLGYQQKNIKVAEIDTSEMIQVILKIQENLINEVVITDKAITKIQNGDTTSFFINNYKSETDKSLGDVLKKLEGIEVTQEGVIEYNGKKIDKLLVEGKDILNDQHKLTTEGLKAASIQKIEIIEQFKSFSNQFSKEWSDKVALNIVLTESAKGNLNGNIEVLAGIKSKYESSLNLYTINEKFGNVNFLRSNNLGEPVISLSDFLSLKSSLLRSINQTNGDLEQLIPSGFKRQENIQISNENLLASNTEIQHNDKVTSKIALLGSFFTRESKSNVNRVYFPLTDIYSGNKNDQIKFPYLYTNFNNKISFDKKNNVEFDFPISLDFSSFNIVSTGFLNQNLIENEFENGKHNLELSPRLYWNHKLNSYNSIKTELGFSFSKRNREILINSDTPIFGTEEKTIHQEKIIQSSFSDILFEWQYSKNGIRTGVSTSVTNSNNLITLSDSLIGYDFSLKTLYDWLVINPIYYLGYKSKKIWLESKLGLKYNNVKSDKKTSEKTAFNPSFLLRYNFSRLHFLLLKLGQKKELIDPILSYKIPNFINDRTLLIASLAPNQFTKSNSISLSYLWMNLLSKSRVHSIFNLSQSQNSIFFQTEFKDNFIFQKAILAKEQVSSNLVTKLDQRIFNQKLILKLNFSYNYTNTKSLNEINIFSTSYGLGIQSNFKKSTNATFNYKRSKLLQKIENLNLSFISNSFQGGITHKKEKIYLDFNLDYNLRRASDNFTNFLLLNFNFEYNLDNNWSLNLNARDILNLKSKQIFTTNFTNQYFENSSYVRFPGSLTIGINKTF